MRRARAVSSSESGESEIVVAFGLPPPQPGRRARSSGRAVQTTRSGTSLAQSTRWSTKSSRPSSAQWRSSKTSTSGPRSASASRKRRQAAKASACAVAGQRPRSPASPTSGRRCVSTQRGSSGSSRTSSAAARELRARPPRPSRVSRMPAWALTISPSAQKRHALAVRQRPTLPPGDQLRRPLRSTWKSSWTRRRLADARARRPA